jgi:hypothetical protein
MVKEAKFFRKQADKAEQMALATSDADASRGFSNLAQAYRSQADALKESKNNKSKKQTPEDKKPKQKAAQRRKANKSQR